MMNVLITGGTGFVGSYLIPELLRKGASCRLLVRSIADAREKLADYPELEFVQGDIKNQDSLKDIAANVTHVIHLAAVGHVSAISEEAYKEFYDINVQGTKNLLKACDKAEIQKFIHFSSTAAMGLIRKEGPVDEKDRPEPRTPYQKSKLESEETALEFGKKLKIPVVVLRPCMIYGKNGYGEFFKMAELMQKGFFPKVGRGRNLTPLVHVNDVAQATTQALDHGVPGEIYFIASNKSLPLDEMRDLVLATWGTKAIYPYIPTSFMHFAAWLFELTSKITGKPPLVTRYNIANTVWDREFSIEKARRELGYEPCVSFENGIESTIKWYKETNC